MTITRIPEGYQRGFARIKELSSDEVDMLVAVLEDPASRGTKATAKAVAEMIDSVSRSEAEEIVRSLVSLYAFKAGDPDGGTDELISDLIRAMHVIGSELAVSAEELPLFREKMTKLLSLRQFSITAKVDRLKSDFSSIFHDLKTITDLRPVFDDVKKKPVGFAVTHTLKLVYHDLGEHKELYLAISPKGLARVKRAVERAELKGSSLKSLLEDTQLKDLSE
jgi:hypothetical protein